LESAGSQTKAGGRSTSGGDQRGKEGKERKGAVEFEETERRREGYPCAHKRKSNVTCRVRGKRHTNNRKLQTGEKEWKRQGN